MGNNNTATHTKGKKRLNTPTHNVNRTGGSSCDAAVGRNIV